MAQGDPSPVIAVPAGRAVQRRFVPRLRQGPTPGEDARDSGTAGGNPAPSPDGDTRLLRRGGKTRKCGPRTPRGAPSLSWPRAVPQADETFGSPHSFWIHGPSSPRKPKRSTLAGAGRVQVRRRGPTALANEPCEHGFGQAVQDPEPGAGGTRRGDERP